MDETQQVPNQNPITPVPPITTYPTPQPVPSSKTPWLVIVIVLLVGIASYFGYQTYQLKKQLIVQPTPSQAITDINDPASTSTPTPSTPTDPNIKTFTSQKLGVTFNYQEKYVGSDETVSTKEIGNRVYVYSSAIGQPDQGQYVEVFNKNPQQSFEDAIKGTILQGYSESDCLIQISNSNPTGSKYQLPTNYEIARIDVPHSGTEDMEIIGQKFAKCPRTYASSGGLAYFLFDSTHPDKYVFFSIGQYALNAGDNITWEDTFRFID